MVSIDCLEKACNGKRPVANQIFYKTVDGKNAKLDSCSKAKIISHTYNFYGEIIFEGPLTVVEFLFCETEITNITLPDSVTEIGKDAFDDNTTIKYM